MNEKNVKRRSWVSVLIVVGLIIVFLVLVDIGAVIDELKNADWGYLALAVSYLLAGFSSRRSVGAICLEICLDYLIPSIH